MKKLIILLFFVIAPAVSNAQDATFKEDVQKLMKAIGIPERIAATKADEAMWVRPDEEKEHLAEVEGTIPEFLQNVENYIMEKYTQQEVKDLLAFYSTPLGQKMTANMANQIAAYEEAHSKWSDAFLEVFFKYQRERKK